MKIIRRVLLVVIVGLVVTAMLLVSRSAAIRKADKIMALAPEHGWVATHARLCVVRDTKDRMHLGWRVVYDTDQALVDFPPYFNVGLTGKMLFMNPGDATVEARLKQHQTVEPGVRR